MEELMQAIARANEDEIEKILRMAISRKRELHPGWEIDYRVRLKGSPEIAEPKKMKKTRRRLYEKCE